LAKGRNKEVEITLPEKTVDRKLAPSSGVGVGATGKGKGG